MSNRLSKESSPYLLQHKDNPVEWFAWGEEAWNKAREENKLVLISIGYSACHWCHVMEHHVFEDFECAEIMNMHFVCIKVDREERPDIDQIYMDAVHLMGSQGGWPLNVFTMPDGKPVYGGTYFPKEAWVSLLDQLVHLQRTAPNNLTNYAARLFDGLSNLHGATLANAQGREIDASQLMEQWKKTWDRNEGGSARAPKFPMPSNLEYMLDFGIMHQDEACLNQFHLTMRKMALGGICDQIGGGFARYSVDDIWKVPHFEKMLYDNAQLLKVYAKAYRNNGDQLYRETALELIQWLQREMQTSSGLYYAAMDADSEGVEGKFYVWNENELDFLTADEAALAKQYFHIGTEGLWEHGYSIPLRMETDEKFAEKADLHLLDLKVRMHSIRMKMLEERSKRIAPGIDIKCIASWNALLVDGFWEAHLAWPLEGYDELALNLAETLLQFKSDETMFHCITGDQTHIPAFLDDFVFAASAWLKTFEMTGDEKWWKMVWSVFEIVESEFKDSNDGICFYSHARGEQLITRKKEWTDNVIVAANSEWLSVLQRMYAFTADERIARWRDQMIRSISEVVDYASGYSNWLRIIQSIQNKQFEIVVAGKNVGQTWRDLSEVYHPQRLLVRSTMDSSLPLLKGRNSEQLTIYVCTEMNCLMPVHTAAEALKFIQ